METSDTIQAALIGAAATLAKALAEANPQEMRGAGVSGNQEWLISAFREILARLEIAQDEGKLANH